MEIANMLQGPHLDENGSCTESEFEASAQVHPNDLSKESTNLPVSPKKVLTPPRHVLGELSANKLHGQSPQTAALAAVFSPNISPAKQIAGGFMSPAAVILSAGRQSLGAKGKEQSPPPAVLARMEEAAASALPPPPPSAAAVVAAAPAAAGAAAGLPRVASLSRGPARPLGPGLEERAAAELEAGQRELAEMLARTRAAYERSRGAVTFNAKKSNKALTIPSTPQLKTNARNGEKEYAAFGTRESPEGVPSWEHAAEKLTEPKPFKVAEKMTEQRLHETAPANPEQMTFGEVHSKLTTAVPRRFHLRRPGTGGTPPAKKFEPKLTVAASPKLHTVHPRPLPPSREEQEAAEMEEARKHQFRAGRLDRRVLESAGELGVPRVTPKKLTVPQEFRFRSETRSVSRGRAAAGRHEESADEQELRKQFRARPMPNYNASARSQSRARAPERRELTQPRSPRLRSASRSRSHSLMSREERDLQELARQFHARPLPATSAPGGGGARAPPRRAEPAKLTVPQPFALQTDQRGQQYQSELQRRLTEQSIEEQKRHAFKATGMPNYAESGSGVPFVRAKELTETQEFHLASAQRHLRARLEAERAREAGERAAAAARRFRARGLPATTFEPGFEVQQSSRELVAPAGFELASAARARQRAHFDAENAARQAALAAMKAEQEEARRLLEENELRELRQRPATEGGLRFVARGMPDPHAPVPAVHPSEKELTVPQTPALQARHRPRANLEK